METILTINNLNKRYGRIHAVKNVSLEIKKGNVYGILGPNGSGKSTTLGIVLNVVNKTSGDYNWFGGTMQTHDALKKVGAIIERPNFYPYMTAQENLELVCATQLPHKVNASVTGQATELVCFRLNEPLALNRVRELGADADVVKNLPLGEFVSYNRLDSGVLAGKVF